MRNKLILAVMSVVMLAGASAFAAPASAGSVDVRNLITVSQFSSTGLSKLPPAELQSFNAWLGQFLNSPAAKTARSGSSTLDVRNFMTVNQYHQSGLENLSPSELTTLNNWFTRYLRSQPQTPNTSQPVTPVAAPQAAAATAASASAGGEFGTEGMAPGQNTETPKRVESRIVGEFTGWNGNTVFKLENGQVWQQAATGYFTNVRLKNPKVVIKKLLFGYLLTLPGQGETVFVRRIK